MASLEIPGREGRPAEPSAPARRWPAVVTAISFAVLMIVSTTFLALDGFHWVYLLLDLLSAMMVGSALQQLAPYPKPATDDSAPARTSP
jgi:hypothetical protein